MTYTAIACLAASYLLHMTLKKVIFPFLKSHIRFTIIIRTKQAYKVISVPHLRGTAPPTPKLA